MKRKTQLIVLVFVSVLLAGICVPANAITNGEPDAGRHPYVGLLVFDDESGPAWRCTGILLSQTVVLCAGHCTEGAVAARIWFAEEVSAVWDDPPGEYPFGGTTSYEGIPYTNPDFGPAPGPRKGIPGFSYRDVGIVVLTEPVPTGVVSEYGELPTPGQVDTLAVMTDVDLVGYGVQHLARPQQVWTGLRARFYAPSKILSNDFAWSDEFIRCSANPGQGKGGIAFGDSGGPVLLAGTKTILAVNSYVTNYNCAGVTYHSRIDIQEVLEWIDGFLP